MALKWRSFAAIVSTVALTSSMILGGCTNAQENTADNSSASVEQSATYSRDEGPVDVQDIYGTNWHFDKPIDKIVATHNPTLNAAVVVGGGGKYIAGVGDKSKADGLYSQVIDNWDEMPVTGSGKDVNLESVAALNPDLALVAERQTSSADTYATIGLKTFVALPNDESLESVKESVTRIGALFGENERAAAINDKYTSLIDEASSACAKATDTPSVLFMGDDLYEVATSSMVQTYIISSVGATNAVQGDYKPGKFAEVDAETIAKFNPDVIWIPGYAHYSVDDVLNDEKLSNVTAVKNKKVYEFPSKLEPWDYPTASACLGVCWAANNLHPDLYSDDQLMQSADSFYSLVYNKTFSAEEPGIN